MRTYSRFAGRLFVAAGCLAYIVTAGCTMTADPEAGRSLPSAWKADSGGLLRVDAVFEFEGGGNLKVAHLTLDENSVQQGIVGGFASALPATGFGPVAAPNGGLTQ